MDTSELSLLSTFGPLGKPKVLTNETGGIIITRDGQAILPHCIQRVHQDLLKTLFNQCITSSSRRGDGLLTLTIILGHLTRHLSEALNRPSSHLQSRIRLLRAIEAIRTIERNRDQITNHLLLTGMWKQQRDYSERIRALCCATVEPAANPEINSRINTIMLKWIGKPSQEDGAADSTGGYADEATVLFDSLVHKSVSARPPTRGDSVLQFISEGDLLLRGRCREHVAVSQRCANAKGFAVLFIKEIARPVRETMDHSIQLISESDILTARRSCTHQVDHLVAFLCDSAQHEGPHIVVCGDTVEDEAVHLLSNAGVYLIDGTPMEYMKYGCRRCQCPLFENITEFMERRYSASSTARVAFVERLVLGSSNEVHLLLRGIVDPACGGTPGRPLPQQLILHGSSAMAVGVHVNMLRRCLKVLRTAGNNGRRNDSTAFSDVLVPGAGAGELAWSVLWSQLAARLSRCHTHELQSSVSGAVPPRPGHPPSDASAGLPRALEPLVDFLGETMLSQLARTSPAALPECVILCEMLSAAYQQVPLTLLANARDVLPESLHTVGGDRRDLHRALLLWRQRLQSAGEGRGRIGLVMTSDLDAEEMCFLGDSVAHGVACSANQFWEVFTEVLDLARLQLRVGGQDGVIRVKSQKQRGKLSTASKGRLDESDSGDGDSCS